MERSQQVAFAFALAAEIVNRIARRKIMVAFRTPLVVIDTVENADEIIAAGAQQAVEFITILRRLNLLRIARTDRRQAIRKDEAGFQGTAHAVKLKAAIRAVQPVGQAELAEVVGVEVAMKGEIVNREERPRTGKGRVA